MNGLKTVIDDLIAELAPLQFSPPVTHVYNPLQYARKAYDQYLKRYARPSVNVVLLGMNPGPWGMAQTGIPFGEVTIVKNWLKINAPIGAPVEKHPKKPVLGFGCTRSEVSGKRLWGWAKNSFVSPQEFFSRFFVANYCPLLFLESNGRNRTPDNLKVSEKKPLFSACDRALRRTIEWLDPRYVVGVGNFAANRAEKALIGLDVAIGKITHPSPANPKANQGWQSLIINELASLGIQI